MKELCKKNYHKVRLLYSRDESEFPLIKAVIELKQDGYIYADSEKDPSSCLAITKFGFGYTFGDTNNKDFNASIANLIFKESPLRVTYFLWYKPPKVWREKLDKLPVALIKKRERIRYRFAFDRFKEIAAKGNLSSQFKLRRVEKNMIEKIETFGIDFPVRFWRSIDDFLTNGFGFCMFNGEDIVSICYTACLVDGIAEVDIATLDAYRGLGLGKILAYSLTEYCLKNHITPTWDCFTYNEPSRKIAENIGFIEKERYSFYSFKRPCYDDMQTLSNIVRR